MPGRIAKAHEDDFPFLVSSGYEKTSDDDIRYNCIAWAAGDKNKWWQPEIIEPWDWWPPGAPTTRELTSFIKAYELVGFKRISDPKYNRRYLTVALYQDGNNNATHAAKLLSSGKWSSKLGDWEDITHNTLSALETDGNKPAYGKAVAFMRRKKK